MNQWVFVISAYAVTLLATATLLLSSAATMRRAERAADDLKKK